MIMSADRGRFEDKFGRRGESTLREWAIMPARSFANASPGPEH